MMLEEFGSVFLCRIGGTDLNLTGLRQGFTM